MRKGDCKNVFQIGLGNHGFIYQWHTPVLTTLTRCSGLASARNCDSNQYYRTGSGITGNRLRIIPFTEMKCVFFYYRPHAAWPRVQLTFSSSFHGPSFLKRGRLKTFRYLFLLSSYLLDSTLSFSYIFRVSLVLLESIYSLRIPASHHLATLKLSPAMPWYNFGSLQR